MFEFATCEMEEFEEGVFDVVVDAARFAFLQTLHSSFESGKAMEAVEDKPQKQTEVDKPREDKADDDRRAAVLKGRPKRRLHSFFRAKSKARVSDASEGEQPVEAQKLKPTRSFIVPHLKSLVSCFRGQMPVGEDAPVKRKKNKTSTFRHRATKSVQVMLSSRGSRCSSAADSSAHRYHRRQDFMREMLESQLSAGSQ